MRVAPSLQFYLDDPIGGAHMNCFKAGLICAHRIVAVSHGYDASNPLACCCSCIGVLQHMAAAVLVSKYGLNTMVNCTCRYAWECQTQEGGWGLDWVLREHSWKLRGIVNGIDTADWSPTVDKFLQSDGYRHYDASSLKDGKAACKAALQRVGVSLASVGAAVPVRPSTPRRSPNICSVAAVDHASLLSLCTVQLSAAPVGYLHRMCC